MRVFDSCAEKAALSLRFCILKSGNLVAFVPVQSIDWSCCCKLKREDFVVQGKVMTGSAIPDDLRRFVLSNALTVPDVEALLIFRATRTIGCDAVHLASRLYVSVSRAEQALLKLLDLGAVAAADEAGAFVYAPRSPELGAVLDRLEDYYSRHLVEVTQLIHSTETKAAQEFADAFRVRKET